MFSVLVKVNFCGGSENTALKKFRANFIVLKTQNTNIKLEKNSIILIICLCFSVFQNFFP